MLCSQNLGKKIKLQYQNKHFSRLLHFVFINNKSKQPISTDNLPSCILDGKYTSDTKYRFSSKNYFRGKWSSVHQYRAKQNLTFFFLKYKTKKLSPRKKGNEKKCQNHIHFRTKIFKMTRNHSYMYILYNDVKEWILTFEIFYSWLEIMKQKPTSILKLKFNTLVFYKKK